MWMAVFRKQPHFGQCSFVILLMFYWGGLAFIERKPGEPGD
jgi:hypothetical protein